MSAAGEKINCKVEREGADVYAEHMMAAAAARGTTCKIDAKMNRGENASNHDASNNSADEDTSRGTTGASDTEAVPAFHVESGATAGSATNKKIHGPDARPGTSGGAVALKNNGVGAAPMSVLTDATGQPQPGRKQQYRGVAVHRLTGRWEVRVATRKKLMSVAGTTFRITSVTHRFVYHPTTTTSHP